MLLSGSLMIPAISLISPGWICMLHACICCPYVLGNLDYTEWRHHGLARLWQTAVGCQTCAAGYAFFKNEASKKNWGPKSEKNVRVLLCNYVLQQQSLSNFCLKCKNGCWFQDEDAEGGVWSHAWRPKEKGGKMGKRADNPELLQLYTEDSI